MKKIIFLLAISYQLLAISQRAEGQCTLGATISVTNITCYGANNGSATVNASGGTTPYTYSWSTGQTIASANGLSAGTYTVDALDNENCYVRNYVIIVQPALLQDSIKATCATCCNCKGTTHIYAYGGTIPYTYSWSNGVTADSLTGLGSDTFRITIWDANGCSITDSVFVHQGVAVAVSQTNICNGGGNIGSASISVNGNYSYSWSPGGQTTNSINGLSAGIYVVTVTSNDTIGCSTTYSFDIRESSPISVSTYENVCLSFGTIFSSVSGGTPPYTYSWSYSYFGTPKNLSSVIVDIDCGGNNSSNLTVTDNNGCTAYGSGSIEPPSQLQSWTTTNSCYGENNGSVTLNWCGGFLMTQYTYTLNPSGQVFTTTTPYTITGLAAGSYTIAFSFGCIGNTSNINFTISQSPQLSVSVTTVQEFCNTSATASVTGGTAPYTYSWSGGAGTNSSAYLTSIGTYTVNVQDKNGCFVSAMVTITQAGSLSASAIVNGNIVCNGSSSGSATGTATGGSLPYTYLWSDAGSQTTATATGLSAGTYLLNVTDSLGCLSSASVSISQPGVFNITGTRATAVTCTGDSNGIASVVLAGGTSPFTYLWNDANSQTTLSATGLSAGTYTIIVHDSCGSRVGSYVEIYQPRLLGAVASVISNVSCYDAYSGKITGIPSYGATPYTYLWSDAASQTTASATGLSAGTYTIVVSDSCGATASASAVITQPSTALSLTPVSINTTGGNCNGLAGVSVTGGISPYTYLWTGGLTTDIITNQCVGDYCCKVTDSIGCIDSVCVSIETSTGTNEVKGESEKVKVYPNPNDGVFTVVLSHAEPVSESQTIIEVYNVLEEKIYNATLNPPAGGQGNNLIDLSTQPDGVYLYRVINIDGGLIGEGKMVIEK